MTADLPRPMDGSSPTKAARWVRYLFGALGELATHLSGVNAGITLRTSLGRKSPTLTPKPKGPRQKRDVDNEVVAQ